MADETFEQPPADAADAAEPPAVGDAGEPPEPPERTEPEWQRRRRLAAVFGDVLPETTSDERDPAGSDGPDGEAAGDRWLRAQVPPHHG